VAIAQEAAARAERLVLMAREAGASDEAVARLERQAEAYRKLASAAEDTAVFEAGKEFADEQAKAFDDAAKSAEEFFTDLILNGKKTFGNLKDEAKRFFAQLAAQLLNRYVLNIGVSGGASGGGIGSILGSIFGGVGYGARKREVVGGDQQRAPLGGQRSQCIRQCAATRGIQGGGGFVHAFWGAALHLGVDGVEVHEP
jgi:hypothetical protein